jgi:hypothetical protein
MLNQLIISRVSPTVDGGVAAFTESTVPSPFTRISMIDVTVTAFAVGTGTCDSGVSSDGGVTSAFFESYTVPETGGPISAFVCCGGLAGPVLIADGMDAVTVGGFGAGAAVGVGAGVAVGRDA